MTYYFTSSDETRIGFIRRGTGPTVIFLHGWMCNCGFWTDQITALFSRYTCIAVDFREHGNSKVSEAPCTMAVLARDVRERIEHLGILECVLVGHSMGAMVAQMLAVECVPAFGPFSGDYHSERCIGSTDLKANRSSLRFGSDCRCVR